MPRLSASGCFLTAAASLVPCGATFLLDVVANSALSENISLAVWPSVLLGRRDACRACAEAIPILPSQPYLCRVTPLRVLGEVVSGPARGRTLVLHLDAALPPEVQRAVVGMAAVRDVPHATFSLGHGRGWQSAGAAVGVLLRGASAHLLHVVLWLKPQPELLHVLCRHWQPHSLLLLTLGPSPGTAVLRHEALGSVQQLALIARLSAAGDALGVYAALPFSHSVVRLLGPWRREAFATWETLFPDRFPSFEGYTFHLATYFMDPPFLYSSAAAPEVGRGMSVWLLDAMAAKLNYSYMMTQKSPDLKWGIVENGVWVGVLGMVARREKNFSVNCYFINEERIRDFDSSPGVGRGLSSAFLPSPQPLPLWLSLVRPFSPTAWAALMLAAGLAMLLAGAMEREAARRRKSPWRGADAGAWQSLPRAVVAQSTPAVPRAWWQRVFLAAWLLGCLVITAAYTCDLVRIFTRRTYARRLHTLQDLVDSHYRVILLTNGGFLHHYVLNSPDQYYEKLRQRLDTFESMTDAVATFQRGDHAYLTDELVSRLTMMKGMKADEWYVMDERVLTGRLVWYFPRGKAWKAKFDDNLRHLNYFGLTDYWFKVEFEEWVKQYVDRSKRLDAPGHESSPAQPLSLKHLQGVFYIVGLAWLAGGVALLLELLWARTPTKSNQTGTKVIIRRRC